MPLAALHLVARILALAAFHLLRYRRTETQGLFARAFPELGPACLAALTRRYYCRIADIFVEVAKAYSISGDELARRVQFTNFELLERYVAAGRSFMLIGSHGANWEWIGLACSARLACEVDVVYKEFRDARHGAFMAAVRSRFGATLIERSQALAALARGGERPRAIALVVDHAPAPGEPCHWLRFLGQDTAFAVGFERIARMWSLPVVHAARRRTGRGRYEVTFEILGEPPHSEPAFTMVERFAASLERAVRASPEDWFWHRRLWQHKRPFYG